MDGKVVKVRGLCLGEGRPKICIPIVGACEEEIYEQARKLQDYPADLVEWRADWLEGVTEPTALRRVLCGLRKILGDHPLLFTVRTAKEGGELSVTWETYEALNLAAAESGQVDLVDVELFEKPVSQWESESYEKPGAKALIQKLQDAGVKVIGSTHDFSQTPSEKVMQRALCSMQTLGVDICKLAVMPQTQDDVVHLLHATWEMKRQYADRPLITMSMGKLGLISRLAGELFGSAVTFGAAGKTSAPGQISADKLEECLELLHDRETKERAERGHIFLIGFMGAGKSTVAEALQKKLHWECMEMDERIEQEAGQSIASMFEQYGETYFRDKETELLLSMEKQIPLIVSCGGGVVVRQKNSDFMKQNGTIVLLTATPETVLARVKNSTNRPILNGNMNVEYIRGLQEKRRALYESVADVTVATDGKTVEEICEEVLAGVRL